MLFFELPRSRAKRSFTRNHHIFTVSAEGLEVINTAIMPGIQRFQAIAITVRAPIVVPLLDVVNWGLWLSGHLRALPLEAVVK